MASAEKTLLVISILLSWVFSGAVLFVMFEDVALWVVLVTIFLGMLLWLTPFALLTLFTENLGRVVFAFTLGSLGFFVIAFRLFTLSGTFSPVIPIIFGVLFLVLGFTYWVLRVRYARTSCPGFSAANMLSGVGLFLTIAALVGAIFYFYSPFAKRAFLEPRVPEQFFEIMFREFSGIVAKVSDLNPNAADIQAVKPQIYTITNAALAELATRYQQYIPFVFIAGVFLFLRVVFSLFRYVLFGVTYLLVKLFTRWGLLRKEVNKVPREVVRF